MGTIYALANPLKSEWMELHRKRGFVDLHADLFSGRMRRHEAMPRDLQEHEQLMDAFRNANWRGPAVCWVDEHGSTFDLLDPRKPGRFDLTYPFNPFDHDPHSEIYPVWKRVWELE